MQVEWFLSVIALAAAIVAAAALTAASVRVFLLAKRLQEPVRPARPRAGSGGA